MVSAGVLGLAAVAVVALPPVRSAATTLALVPELLGQGPRLLSAVAPPPTVRQIGYGSVRRNRADIYLPSDAIASVPATGLAGASATPRPAIVLVLGINQVALDHPAVVRTATALARAGFVVAVPADAELAAGRMRPDAVDQLIDAVEAVAAQPEVDDARIGLAGFSAGGSIALLAAADPELAERLAWVNALGAYADATTLLVDIASRTTMVDGHVAPWQPGALARHASLELILDAVPDRTMRGVLRAATEATILAGGLPPSFDRSVAAGLKGDAAQAYRLLTARTRDAAEAALARLSPQARATLAALSPVSAAARIRAPVFLMHDVGDDAIPFSQLAPLATSIPPAAMRRVTALGLLDHVQPDAGGVTLAQAPDLWDLFAHLQDVFEVAR